MTVILLSRKIGHGQLMTPVNIEVCRSNVKVTLSFYAKTAQYVEKLTDMVLGRKIGHTQ